jgi:hypothetical protein
MKKKLTVSLILSFQQCIFFVISLLQVVIFVTCSSADAGVSLYIVDPMSKQKILPNTTILPTQHSNSIKSIPPVSSSLTAVSLPGSTISIRATRGEFRAASFVIRPASDLTNISVNVTDLIGPNGAVIAKDAIDLRLVKCWYQAGSGSVLKGTKTLTPELLLKDDNLVKVDVHTEMNYLKVRINNQDQYIDITSVNAVFPDNAEIHHANMLQPFDVQANTNKQIWLTLHVPASVLPGQYMGTISLKSRTELFGTVKVALTVLPFDLLMPAIDYGLYYRAVLTDKKVKIQADRKSADQYRIELQNMKDHGVLYPTLAQNLDDSLLGQALSIRKNVGLPTDRLYSAGWYTQSITNPKALLNIIAQGKQIIDKAGCKELYIYGKDEVRNADLITQRPVWQAVHGAGAKVFAAVYVGASDMVGDLLDLPNQNAQGSFRPEDIAKWHNLGKKVFIYSNPQVGVEDAEIYRRNYGIPLMCAGYDGVMNFAYQYGSEYVGSSIWNDFDAFGTLKIYRDHVFAYPTNGGVIDTIQWEGFREAINDARYFTTLGALNGKSARQSICDALQQNADLASLRESIIDRIIAASKATKSSQR